jgi:hypothetical protein
VGKIYAEGFMVPTANPRTTTQPAVSQPTVRQMVPMKIKTCILLMEAGIATTSKGCTTPATSANYWPATRTSTKACARCSVSAGTA